MCGIVGIVVKDSGRYMEAIDKMVQSLYHRGPDEQNTYFFPNCTLGHTRLSIIDLKTGQQPMLAGNKSQGIVFNGEIYGYKDIKKNHLPDYPFKTTSDTEVILGLYQKYQEKMLGFLPGMFSFGLWDNKKQALFCARDRFGEKPFFYCFGTKGEFIFASEIKALIASGLIKPVLNIQGVIHYLQHAYIHPYQTIYKNIYRLPPAHYLIFKDGAATIKQYWHIPEERQNINIPDAVEMFEALLNKAVTKQMVADVPVGAFLSGGLDSSTIVSIASQLHPNLKTFSFKFEDSTSELPYARAVARMYQTDHTELFDHEDIGELLLHMDGVYDEPFADSSNIPTYLISKLAKQYATVILTGDGGDELLGGYEWYWPLYHMKQRKRVNANVIKENILHAIAYLASRTKSSHQKQLFYHYQGLSFDRQFESVKAAYDEQNKYFSNLQVAQLSKYFSTDTVQTTEFMLTNTINDAINKDIYDYLPGDILTKTDRASMVNALELRAPFLDVDLAEFCLSLPGNLKIRDSQDKWILRQALSQNWPESVQKRTKQGFGGPVYKWLTRESVKILKGQYLSEQKNRIFDILDFSQVQKYAKLDSYQTWILLILAIWCEKHDFELE